MTIRWVNPTIDITFDFRADAGGGDPDRTSPTLRSYHKLLWSKQLASGHEFQLDDTTPGAYLHHRSDLGEFCLTSDSVIHTFRRWKRFAAVRDQIPEADLDHFFDIAYTIGAMLVFPGNKVAGKMTINGARGLNHQICDRLDLTVECIRRHYLDEDSPLHETLARYRDFFELFGDFAGYVEFFLLQDLTSEDLSRVRFFTPFENFASGALPTAPDIYRTYMENSIDFVNARNRRIRSWAIEESASIAL